jgi:hypothetical protein
MKAAIIVVSAEEEITNVYRMRTRARVMSRALANVLACRRSASL